MINKLPIVGKRYKNKTTKDIYKAFKHKTGDNCYFMENQSQGWDLFVPLHDFFIEFEELPEDKAETKPETQSHFVDVNKMELSPEVKEAMEGLKQEQLRVLPTSGFYNSGVRWHSCYNDLRNRTKNLLDALDKQFDKTPNEETLKSFSDYEKGVGLTEHDSVEELFDDLEENNA